MAGPSVGASSLLLDWLDVGEPPAEVATWRRARVRKVTRLGAPSGAALTGGLAGFAATVVWPGAVAWTLTGKLELFVAVAIPLGVADYFFNRWMFAWLGRVSELHVRRLAIFGENIRLDPPSGKTIEIPLKRTFVSRDPIAADWYNVVFNAGQVSVSFFVPPVVASMLSSATESSRGK